MNISDPKFLEQLRDLPSSYLLDLLADNDEMDKASVVWVLRERGLNQEEVEAKILHRRQAKWPRPYSLWKFARWLTLFNVLLVSYFNATGGYRLLYSEHAFKGPIIFLAVGCIAFGLVIGYKLTTVLYQGSATLLYCGFPIAVGSVDLQSGEEHLPAKPLMLVLMSINALVGVNFILFPLTLIFVMMA